ncbi:2OG-Fe dioxygenase family protein [Pseudomonas alliivorans]|nr:2OG-Fe dioxygenase family protein [Pseudomonas alliivorans]MEE4718362.1 2OG-Fe dioxygenase family protein [Pseudomonas alliivorans]MEE4723424.1 2OG-Fe dioxygenase family protein [Pseudomonas alliivorans]MEE4759482.1 2OG-Fe dioxygenase family protein [Pseudomonas alliivorans]MEE4764028.1 2OG-Fe dioxygenase family protein [Pseudomonas alliivorans]
MTMQAMMKEMHVVQDNPLDIVTGFRFVPGSQYRENITLDELQSFHEFYESQIADDPYASQVRDRGMVKVIYNPYTSALRVSETQNYFQSYGANDSDGGKVRVFPSISPVLVENSTFQKMLGHDAELMRTYCDRFNRDELNLSVHFIRYKALEGGASYSSPVWLHVDDEPLVFIHLINLTSNALGADNVISGMDNKPTHVLRLTEPLDTLIVDTMKKHAVTPLGSSGGMAYRDVMLINLEADLQQK